MKLFELLVILAIVCIAVGVNVKCENHAFPHEKAYPLIEGGYVWLEWNADVRAVIPLASGEGYCVETRWDRDYFLKDTLPMEVK